MKKKRILSFILAAAATAGIMSGCGEKKQADGKVNLSVGLWADETRPEELKMMTEKRENFMKKYPDINIIPDTYQFDTTTFLMKSAANQLPNMFVTYFTEVQQVIKAGAVADLTDFIKSHNMENMYNPKVLEYCKGEDGKIYALPQSCYSQGLYINKKLFTEAGLVNEDGSPKVPDTYEELAEYAKIIKEKTGKAGYVIPTINNCGGWHFLNIGWAFGVEFEKQREDGTWEATFDTPEMREAMQYLKDLKWKYDAVPADTVLDQAGMMKQFGTGNAAMMFANPPANDLSMNYGMNTDDIYAAPMPKGKAGRFSQMGGGVYMFTAGTSSEQLDAAYKWLDFGGYFPNPDEEENEENKRENYETQKESNCIILDRAPFSIWSDTMQDATDKKLRKEYANVKSENYEKYYDFSDVTINPEPSACAQELYSVLDKVIQQVLTDENADVDALVKEANNDFQVNHLDKMSK